MIKMNGLRPYINYLTAFAFAFAVSSCVDEGPKEETTEGDAVAEEVVIEDQVHYAVPSPHETMEFLKATGSKFNSSVLCSTDIREKYVDLKGKSMGLGIYIADLAYAASFGEFQESIKYFNAIVLMADDIGIGSSFNEGLMNRIENNLDQTDSLQAISDASYYKIIGDLEASDRGKIVAMMAAGGFLESLFIAVQSVDKFDAEDPMMERIAAQKLIFENIMSYLDQYKEDQNVEWTIMEMSALTQIFSEVSDNRRDTEIKTNKQGKRVLGGVGGVYITEPEFEDLRGKVTMLRNSVTFNNPMP